MTDAQKEKRMMVSYPGLPSDEPHEESPDCRGQGCIPLESLRTSSPVTEQGKAGEQYTQHSKECYYWEKNVCNCGVAEGTQQEAPPLTYEQEVHALLWSAKSNTESLIQYFYAQAKIERGDMARITRKCIENAQETVRRLEAIIPQALERRELASRALPERKDWIPVSERIPSDNNYVLMYLPEFAESSLDSSIQVGWLDQTTMEWQDWLNFRFHLAVGWPLSSVHSAVTHWMSLPEPPGGENSAKDHSQRQRCRVQTSRKHNDC